MKLSFTATLCVLVAFCLLALASAQCNGNSCTRPAFRDNLRDCQDTFEKKAFVPYGEDLVSRSLKNKVTFEKCTTSSGISMGYSSVDWKAHSLEEGCRIQKIKDASGKRVPQLVCPGIIKCCADL